MSVKQIKNALPGESLIGVEPELLQQVDPGWLHRLAMFTGRTLTASALQSEQQYRAGRLAILGQSVTHGIVKGLEISANLSVANPALVVTPGYGISASGEDVTLLRTLRTTLGALQVVDPQTGSVIGMFANYAANAANTAYAGVLLLQPITGQVSGAAVDTGSILVSGNLNASCGQDPAEYAFQDWQIVDGVRLVMVAWPALPAALALPSSTPPGSWRNRLAYTVFNAEMALSADECLPWDLLGVPVGLVGFDATWKPQFVDRSSVVRAGGLARGRYLLPLPLGGAGTPLLVSPSVAQARVSQFTEQLAATPGLASLTEAFSLVPPCGILPASSMDFVHHGALWFPFNWTITAGPIHQEEIETSLLESMTAQPLDVTQNETVQILIPLPDALCDPDILVTESVADAFTQAITDATTELAGDLQHRKAIQQEANALSLALTGTQAGSGTVQPPLITLDAGLTTSEIALRDQTTYTPVAGEMFGTTPPAAGSGETDYSADGYTQLISYTKQAPYTIFNDGNGAVLATPLPIFAQADLDYLGQNGIQSFINSVSSRVARANDLLDLAFLTTQSDIYRFRQYVLGTSDATALAVSPIAAEIAQGVSAASTASNLQSYLTSVLPVNSPPTTTTPPPSIQVKKGRVAAAATSGTFQYQASSLKANTQGTRNFTSPTALRQTSTVLERLNLAKAATANLSAAEVANISRAATFAPVNPGTVTQPASASDVLGQSPLVGAQLNLRTLSVAARLANPPSQEGLFYSINNRVALLQLLSLLDLTIDDLAILVDPPPAPPTAVPGTTQPPAFSPLPTIADIRLGAKRAGAVFDAVMAPTLYAPKDNDTDEASLFSSGIHVLEQHSSILRAVEGRIQLYNDFLSLCQTALTNVQANLAQGQTLLAQLENDLAQGRQDLAFTTALYNDEVTRVTNVNAQRLNTLANYVQVVVYARPRTLVTAADVPSRQLVPGNVANPVPACMQNLAAIPQELREIISLLREAPVSWMPSIQALLNRLEHPSILQDLAVLMTARASMQLALPLRTSSALSEPGVYSPVIATIFSSNQTVIRTYQTQRATFTPAQLVNQSWASQVQTLRGITASGDLIASSSVHAEVVNATSLLLQRISSVATCLYARACDALPLNRLNWAEFLRGLGLSIQLQSLAVLPGWTTQDYVARQQMQMLVDWLFLQIDRSNSAAVAFMSDVVRAAMLLAAGAPVGTVMSGAVTLTTPLKLGGIVPLTLPSDRIAHGTYVQLYSAGVLAAQAVVTDLDSSSASATVTQIYTAGATLAVNDVAHFTSQTPQAPALRAFDR